MVKLAYAVKREKFKSSPTISSGMEETLPALIDSVGSSFEYYNYDSGVPEENRVTAHRFFYPSLAKISFSVWVVFKQRWCSKYHFASLSVCCWHCQLSFHDVQHVKGQQWTTTSPSIPCLCQCNGEEHEGTLWAWQLCLQYFSHHVWRQARPIIEIVWFKFLLSSQIIIIYQSSRGYFSRGNWDRTGW